MKSNGYDSLCAIAELEIGSSPCHLTLETGSHEDANRVIASSFYCRRIPDRIDDVANDSIEKPRDKPH
jgi:hypothetical protein